MELIISKNRIARGIKNGAIKFVKSPHNDGIVCQIGEHWFYFCGKKAEEYDDPEVFLREVSRKTIIDGIFSALWDLQHDGDKPSDEWIYYFLYLDEYEIHENNSKIIEMLEKNGISRDGDLGWLYPWEPGADNSNWNSFFGLLTPKQRKDMRK